METAHRHAERVGVEWASGLNILAGLWVAIAPFALGHERFAAIVWNNVIVGLAVAILAIFRVSAPEKWEGISWTNFALGVWLIIAPFILGYASVTSALWNDIIMGIVVLGLAFWSAMETRAMHDAGMRGDY